MTPSELLLKEAEASEHTNPSWGKYGTLYDWEWINNAPFISPVENIETTAQVVLRDWTIAKKLKELEVKSVLDIGSDSGHFIAVLKHFGIRAIGTDASEVACNQVKSKGQNSCYKISIETLITLDIRDFDCISCMNITQADWKNESLKTALISWMSAHAKILLLTDNTHQDKHWDTLKLIHDFNELPFYFSRFVVRAATKLGFGRHVNYLYSQKIFSSIQGEKNQT